MRNHFRTCRVGVGFTMTQDRYDPDWYRRRVALVGGTVFGPTNRSDRTESSRLRVNRTWTWDDPRQGGGTGVVRDSAPGGRAEPSGASRTVTPYPAMAPSRCPF